MMKGFGLSVAAATAFAALPLFAQQGGQTSPPASPPSVQVPTTSAPARPGNGASQVPTANAPAASAPGSADLKPVKTELVGKLDSKSAKAGDPVVVKTREAVTTASGTEIPKGSKLLGHVTKVQAHTKESPNSEVAVQIDQAQLKDGQTLPIHSVIQSVSLPEGSGSNGPADAMPAPMGPSGGAPAGSGSMSGSRTGAPVGNSPAVGASPSAPSSAPMPSADAGSAQASSTGSVAGRVVAGSGATAIRTTGIPNVFLASNPALQDSGVLFAAKDNVHLGGGTQMVLAIAATGSH